jgi:hypothetical protein
MSRTVALGSQQQQRGPLGATTKSVSSIAFHWNDSSRVAAVAERKK